VQDALGQFGAGKTTPGSGSAASLIALVGCKLLQTVVTISRRKNLTADEPSFYAVDATKIDGLERKLSDALDEDSRRYQNYWKEKKASERLPEKSIERRRAVERTRKAYQKATDSALHIASVCVDLAREAMMIYDNGFEDVRGNSLVGITSAIAGAEGSIGIVYLNLASFTKSEWAEATRKNAEHLALQIHEMHTGMYEAMGQLQKQALRAANILPISEFKIAAKSERAISIDGSEEPKMRKPLTPGARVSS
jgi:formiminotetrahydrofolate cyclodeaminase